MSNLNFAPHDVKHLKQYKLYANNLGYSGNESQWKYSAINKYAVQSASTCNELKSPIVVLYKITINNNTTVYNTSFVNKKNNTLEYICPTGSILSNNGEYRSGLLNYNNFDTFLTNNKNIKKLLENIINYIKYTFDLNTSIFTTEYFYPEHKHDYMQLDYDTCVYFFSIAWIKFYYEYQTNILSNNLNTDFKIIMLFYKKHNKSFTKFIAKYAKDFEVLIYICYNNIIDKVNLYESIKLGQKLTMLNLAEYNNAHNIEHNIWCEISINNKIRTLITSKITNNFAFSNKSIIIYISNIANLFDNPNHFDKIIKSNIATQVVKLLTQAKQYTLPVKFNKNLSKIIKEITYDYDYKNKNQNSTLDILHNNIQAPINYAKENIILSNYVLNMISEYTGLTFYDAALHGTNMFSTANYDNFYKYIFQLLYGLYCLNTKVHCIHGDLHLNNITIAPLFSAMPLVDIQNPQIIYIVDQHYAFVNNFHNLCIIDFNNSIVNPDLYNTQRFNKDTLLQIQIENLLLYLYSVKPEYKQYDVTIKNNMLYHFNEYFKVLSALDIYNISSKLLSFINKKKQLGNICKNTIALITNMLNLSNHYITTKFQQLLHATDYTEFINMEWPALCIIKQLFKITIPIVANTVTDIYAYDNKSN